MAKVFREKIITCLDCPCYHFIGHSGWCNHRMGCKIELTMEQTWNGQFPKWCPLEDWEDG